MRYTSAGSGTHRGRRRLIMWLGVFSLLMSLMGPMFTLWAADAAAARGEEQEQECDPGFYYDENAGACVEEPDCPEGQAWDADQASCVDDPNYQPEQEDEAPVGIQIEKWYCESADPSWGYQEFSSNCEQNSDPVTLTHGGEDFDGRSIDETSQTGPSFYEWTDQPAGNHYVYEDIPDGYGTPRVFCGVYVPESGQPSPAEMTLQNGNAVGWSLNPGEYVYCWWFNILEGYGQIHITKYDCASFTEDPTQATWQYLQSECDTWSGDPVEYQLWQGSNQVDSASTGSGGEASFDQAATGDITVAEVLPEGYTYSIVYCWYHPADAQNGQAEADYQPVNVQDGSYHTWTLEPGYILDCYWFNFYEGTGSTIDFYKYVCAYDTPFDQDYDYYLENCQIRENWDFTVSWDGGGSTETTDTSGKATWTGVPQGDWSGSEELDDSWNQPHVWCRYVEWPDEADYDDNWFPYDPSGGQIDRTFEYDGVHIECYWFNFEYEGGDYNWVDFYKYTCPYDLYESGGSWDYYSSECTPTEDWDFDLSWDGGGSTETTDGDGLASWSEVPQGSWTGSESVPDGWEQPYVYCRYVEWPDDASYSDEWTQWDVTDGSIDWEFEYDSGVRVECYWFNFAPDNYNWVDFYKYTCPYDLYESGGSWDYFSSECTPTEDWDFDLSWDGGGSTETTDPDGKASWSTVPQGPWTGSEEVPDGWEQPIIFCRYVEWPDDADYSDEWTQYEASDGSFDFDFEYESGIRFECYWFNFAPDNYNWVDFYKYSCPYDLYEGGGSWEYYSEECSPVEDWTFDLIWENGGNDQTTDGDGHAGWSGVPDGTWTGSETLEEGWAEPYIFCRYVEWPDEADYTDEWFQVTSSSGSFDYEFEYESGIRIECYWFNFAPDNYNWVDFYKYTCPTSLYESGGSWDYYINECEPLPDWPFDLSWDGGGSTEQTDSSGLASWSTVPQGSWTGHEDVPDGWETPYVYCRYVEWPDDADYTDEWTQYDVTDGSISGEFEYESGVRIECYWFNFEPEDYNWVDFYKYTCAYDVPVDQDIDYYTENCELTEGWDYTLGWDSGGSESKSTGSDGHASWSGIPTGGWWGQEDLPGGYGDPIVWCRYVEWPDEAGLSGDWESYTVTDGRIEGSFDYDNTRIECYWFNFEPEGGSWIQFYKLWCSDEATYDATFDDLLNTYCEYRDDLDAKVSLTYGGSTTSKTATGQTPAEWQGVPTGEWTVEESQYDGWGQPIIWCQYVEWPEGVTGYDQEPWQLETNGWQASWTHEDDGLRIACVIFNIPYQENWVEITKWWCSEDVTTPYDREYSDLTDQCETYTDGVDFSLEWNGGSETQTTDGDGNAEWGGLPGGDWSLHETVPDGYSDPIVWCYWVEWPSGVDVSDEPYSFQAPHGSFTGSFDWSGMRIHCDIFNIPTYDPGWITVYKWYCAEGIPVDSAPEYLRDQCDIVTTGVDFSLAYGDVTVPMTTDSSGKAEWTDVPVGSWTLTETVSEGYGTPVIYCQWVEWPGDYDSEYSEDLYQPDQEGASITGTHQYPGLKLVCYWFNFEYETGNHWVTFYKYYCPPSSDYGSDLSEWVDNCQTQDGVEFVMNDGSAKGTSKATAGGTAEWTGLPDGDYTFTETRPEGYANPVVWCTRWEYTPGEETTQATDLATFESATIEEGTWSTSVEGGPWRIVCYWFNIPGDESTITVYKYNCEYKPSGYTSLWQWQEACNQKGDGITFTLDNSDGSSSKETANGVVEWTDVPTGEFTITEDPVAGYGTPVIWCGWTAYYNGAVFDAFPTQYQGAPGIVEGEISYPGTTWFCWWFNIPEEHSKIVIYKFNCPDGVNLNGDLDDYKYTCKEYGDGVDFTLENSSGSSTKTVADGNASWYDVPEGDFTVTESLPEGYGEAVWWCGWTGYDGGAVYDGFPQRVEAPGGVYEGSIDYDVTYYFCWVFNFPDYDREITVYKWWCPADWSPDSQSYEDWKETCTYALSGVSFNLSWDGGSSWKNTNISGRASWYGYDPGEFALTEQYLPGYETPYVFCSLEAYYEDGAAYAENFTWYDVSDRSVTKDLSDYQEYKWTCHFFNIEKGPGDITIYKYNCPPGYDPYAWNADPTKDCSEARNGVDFVLDQPTGPNVTRTTGDDGEGTVFFGDLDPGKYVVTEMVPSDTEYVFIWDCYGGDIPAVHPRPLQWGNTLNVKVAGGDHIVCYWYNVPYPQDGWVTLYKYQCWTKTYTSDVDCEIYEFGASFELFAVDGNASQGTGTTNEGGTYTWSGLDEGGYTLDEISHQPCKITSTKVTEDGDIWVDAGQETIVKVYNCSPPDGTPTPGGKVPTKYPNTGVDDSGDTPVVLPQDDGEDDEEASDDEDTQVIEPDDTEASPDSELTDQEAAAEFYTIACIEAEGDDNGGGQGNGDGDGQGNGDGDGSGNQNEDDNESDLPPFLQGTSSDEPDEPTGDDGEEASDSGDEDQAATTDEECVRGALPQQLVIDAADVNYPVEYLEILDGVMEAPTGPQFVSWYKETARLGEQNNIVIAAHVNWWNVPEGPFYHLADLEEGDRIEVTGDDGKVYVFEVQWVRQESNLDAPNPEVVGPTGEATLTLITCGGEWDPAISEYNERTVVRAIQVDVIDTGATTTDDEATPTDEDNGQSWPAPVAFIRSIWTDRIAA